MHLCAYEQQITLAGSYKSEPLLQHVLEILPIHLQDFCPECTNHLLHAEYHADPTASTHVDRDDFAQVVQVGLPELESLGLTTRAAATLSGAAWSQQQQGVEWKPSLYHTKTTKTAMMYVHKTEKLLDGVFWEILMHIFFPFLTQCIFTSYDEMPDQARPKTKMIPKHLTPLLEN